MIELSIGLVLFWGVIACSLALVFILGLRDVIKLIIKHIGG